MLEPEFDKLVAESVPQAGWTVHAHQLIAYPAYNAMMRATTFATAFVAKVVDDALVDEHIVVVSFRHTDAGPEYDIACSDKFLHRGMLTPANAEVRCKEAAQSVNGAASLVAELQSNHGLYQPVTSATDCPFYTNWRRSRQLCPHTTAMLAALKANITDFKSQLSQAYDGFLTAPASSSTPGDTLGLSDLAFKVPVLFVGDRGAGKTMTARAFARDNGYSRVEMGGHDGVESTDMLGFSIQAPDGAMVWKDGPVSEAFRKAKTAKTVLIVDEMLRIRAQQLSLLLTAFSPDDGVYRIRTGRIVSVVDGVANEEELECPVENLCVIATTNIGCEYSVSDLDPALAERFVPLRMDTSEAELRRILAKLVAAHKMKPAVVTKCVTFYKKMLEALARGLIARIPTTRTLTRAILLASDEPGVVRALKTQRLLWVASTAEGKPVPEQLEVIDGLLKTIFSKSKES